jgi:hypothetical protein
MGYGIEPLDACLIYANCTELAKKTLVWPHPEELFLGGSKIQVYEDLRVASLSLDYPTPVLATIEKNIRESTFIKDYVNGKIQGVLKREYSKKSQHVILPTDPDISSTIKKALMEEENTWLRVQDMFGRPKWFIQPIVAQLLHVGEVRCFIVSGRLLYKITTTPGTQYGSPWEVTSHDLIRPLNTHQ